MRTSDLLFHATQTWLRRATIRAGSLAIAAGVFTSVGPTVALAQSRQLTGSVHDDRGQPVSGVRIMVRGHPKAAVTDVQGNFRVPDVPTGLTFVAARGDGVLPAVELIRLSAQDSLDFVLERVIGDRDSSETQRAEREWTRTVERYTAIANAARTAAVITDRDIAERSPSSTADLFRQLVGFRVVGAGAGAFITTRSGDCAPNVFIDGQEQVRFNINEIRPTSIKVMLAYNGYAIVPAALRSLRVDGRCGVVSIVTR